VSGLPWAPAWPWLRCRARGGDGCYYGRCDLRRGHDGAHALERGMLVLRFDPGVLRYEGPEG
jgi:hypothetical protein